MSNKIGQCFNNRCMCTALLAHSCAVMYKYIPVCNCLALWKLMYIYESFCRTHYICVSIIVHLCTTIPLHPCVILNLCILLYLNFYMCFFLHVPIHLCGLLLMDIHVFRFTKKYWDTSVTECHCALLYFCTSTSVSMCNAVIVYSLIALLF